MGRAYRRVVRRQVLTRPGWSDGYWVSLRLSMYLPSFFLSFFFFFVRAEGVDMFARSSLGAYIQTLLKSLTHAYAS